MAFCTQNKGKFLHEDGILCGGKMGIFVIYGS
jgi:hypothetical protein